MRAYAHHLIPAKPKDSQHLSQPITHSPLLTPSWSKDLPFDNAMTCFLGNPAHCARLLSRQHIVVPNPRAEFKHLYPRLAVNDMFNGHTGESGAG